MKLKTKKPNNTKRPIKDLSEKDILRRINHLSKTIECGLHSGFPPCCIAYYIKRLLWFNWKEKLAYNKKTRGTGYIPCPKCLKNKTFVKVRKCPKNTHCWHSAECAGDDWL